MRASVMKGLLALAIVTLACSSGDITGPGTDTTATGGNNTPGSVVITPPASSDLIIGQTINLVAAVRNTSGQDISGLVVSWSSSDPSVASISATGALTALKVGTTVITGSSSGKSASVTINVKPVPVANVAVTVKTAIIVGESATAAAVPTDAAGNTLIGRTVSWQSRSTGVASVTATGVVTGVSAGTAIIDAIVDGVQGSATIVVSPAPVLVNSIAVSLSQTSATLAGQTASATAVARDAAGNVLTNKVISWSSSNQDVATVSQLGIITAVATGSTTITAAAEGKSGTATFVVSITVQTPVASVTLFTANPRPSIGATSQISATLRDANAAILTNRVIGWTSSNPSVATVSQSGLVTAVGFGTAIITASSEGSSGTVSIQVIPSPVTSVTVALPPASLQPTETTQLSVTLRDAGNAVLSGRAITYVSSNPAVATVSATGFVTAIAKGSTNITVTSEGVVSIVTITVPPVTTINVTAPSITLQPTQTTQAAVALLDNVGVTATNRVITWASSVPAVATVSATGLVTAIAKGTTVISVTSEGVTGNLTITVPPVALINVTAPNVTLQPGGTTQAAVALLDATNTAVSNRVIAWTSSAPGVATVSATGLVTAIAKGTTNVTVTSEGVTGSVTITVPPVTTINVTAPNASVLQPTQNTQAVAALLDAGGNAATNRAIVWASSTPAVATVTPATGVITAIAAGTTNVTVTSEGVVGTLVVTVPAVSTVTVAVAADFQLVGATTQATATLRDANSVVATNRSVTWSSLTPTVATISPTGLITAVAIGTSVIQAVSEGKTGTFTFTVVPPVGSVTLNTPQNTLLVNENTQITATVRNTFGAVITNVPPVWTSSDPARATVSQTGLVTQIVGGSQKTVTISARAGNVTQTSVIQLVGHPTETIAALPQTFLNTAAPPAPDAGGTVITVSGTGNTNLNLQNAINAAQLGDVIELPNGVTFVGNFQLPNKGAGTKWITIRPVTRTALPAEGSRMTPAIAAAANLPKIQSPNNNNAILTVKGAHHFRFIGIEVSTAPSVTQNFGLIALDGLSGQTTIADVPHNIVLDRMYIHGTATLQLRRCVLLNSASTAVIDSDLRDCHEGGVDSQAIAGYNGPGPFKIVNNYLEGAGENVIFGGADPTINNLIPSDIEIRRNHIFKPLAWKGSGWLIKNHFELKNAQRVLVEGNIFENNWADGQDGSSILMKAVNQNNTCLWCTTQDVTMRYNIIRNVGSGFNLAGSPDQNITTTHARRMTIHDNLMTDINTGAFGGAARAFVMIGDPAFIVLSHNTIMSAAGTMNGAFVFGPLGQASVSWTARDNVVQGGSGGLFGDNFSGGTAFSRYAPNGTFVGNVMIYGFPQGYPAGNSIVSSINAVGFVNGTSPGGNYALAGGSAFKNAASDGRDPGADLSVVATATANVVVP